MSGIRTRFPGLTVYLTQLIALCNTYYFFGYTEDYGYTYIELWPWLLLGTATYGAVALFLRQERGLVEVVVFGGICLAIQLAVLSLWFIGGTGLTAWIIAWIFIGSMVVQSCLLNLNGCTEHTVLLCCELPSLGIAFLLCMAEVGVFQMPSYYFAAALVVLCLNFSSLSMMRIRGDEGVHYSGASMGILGGLLAVLAAISLTLVAWFSAVASRAVSGTSAVLVWVGTTILSIVTAILTWFFGLFPGAELEGGYSFESEELILAEESEVLVEADPRVLMVIGIVLLLAVVASLLWLVYRLRKWRLSGTKQTVIYHRPVQMVKKVSILTRIKRLLGYIYEKCAFALAVQLKQNTPQGAVIVLSRLGKTRGVGRGQGESYHGYLQRLAGLCFEEDETAIEGLLALSNILDTALYAPQGQGEKLTPRQYREMRRAVARLSKQPKEET